MSLFNIGGLSSGLDTNEIVDAYVEARSYRLTQYKDEQAELVSKQEAYQNVSVNLLGVQSMATQLASPELFKSFKASSSSESVATVTAGSSASKATYNLEVLQLATATNVSSNRFTRSSAAISTGSGIDLNSSFATAGFAQAPTADGSVTFTMEDGGTGTFNLADYSTVQDFLDAVNSSTDIGIKLDYSSSTDGFRIRSTTGEDFALSETGTTGFFTATSMFPSATSSEEISIAGSFDITKSFADAGFEEEVDGTVTINGVTFDPLAYSTVQDFMDAVNNSSEAGVTLSYNSGDETFTLTSDKPGETFTLSESGTNGFLSAAKLSTLYSTAPDPSKNMDTQTEKFFEPVEDSVFRINGVEFNVDISVDSINDILDEINDSQAGVTAIYDYSTNTFNFASKTEGNASISFTQVSGNFLSAIGVYDPTDEAAGVENRGQDAKFVLNGTTMTRSSNDFELSDLKFSLKGVGDTQVSVSLDTSSIVTMVKGFVEKYNEVMDYLDSVINEATVIDPETDEEKLQGLLNSDPLLVEIDSELQNLVGASVYEYDALSGTQKLLGSLEDLGITSGGSVDQTISGYLTFDSSTLLAALKEDPDKVAKIFSKNYIDIKGESPEGTRDGTNTTFQLANKGISLETDQRVQVILNGTSLTQVVDRSKTLGANEFRLNYNTGVLELGTGIIDSDTLAVNYSYSVDGGRESGVLTRINQLLEVTTEADTGSIEVAVGSLKDSYTNLTEQIDAENLRIESYREQMLSIFTSLETTIAGMNSDAEYLSSMLGSSSSK